MTKDYAERIRLWLEELDRQKDTQLFSFIEKYWPRHITPNQLSWLRIGIGFALFILLFNFRNANGLVIFPLFLLGALTDLLDGPIARCLNMKTSLGEILDPIADRILLIPIFIYTIISHQPLLFFIIFFEIVNALLSLFAKDKQISLGSNIFGRTKMFLQSVVLIAMLLLWPATPNIFFISLLWVSVGFMVMSLVIKIINIENHYLAVGSGAKNQTS